MHKTSSLLASIATTLALPAVHAALLVPGSTSQQVSASGEIEESGLSDSQSDSAQSLLAQSFVDQAFISFSLDGGSGQVTASSSLNSSFLTDAINAIGGASASAQSAPGFGVTDTAQSTAASAFSYKFEVSEPVTYNLSGSVSGVAPEGGPASSTSYVSLRIDGGVFLFSTAPDEIFADSGPLTPGVTYVLTGYAHAGAFDFQALGTGASANYDFAFSVTPVPEPQHYALAAGLALIGFGAVRRISRRRQD
ncbi:MAG TPA: hypothetical protein PKE47_09910 [Verrucomicrobiota bacterium]|nr:hypothetical protein [Verrucomicrobiota bacterium]